MKISIILWCAWYVYWIVSARHRVRNTPDAPAKHESLGGRLVYMVILILGFVLLFGRVRMPYGQMRLWSASRISDTLGLAIQTIGLAFSVWARRALGKNWSARVTIGARQELIIAGPYRIVRHPIYSGLLFALIGTAIIAGNLNALAGFLLILVSVLIKLRREESALREHFGETYVDYARCVPALVPGWPTA
jgi:protein-S-isoprenylcysteine O-methyltransferase Ste14